MCDLTEVQYLPDEIVWVKLGSCWWPGEVKDIKNLPEDMVRDFKKKPLAIVKFFGEDTYEYVKNLDNIYHYNNRRKMEFIKKGMDLYRSKSKQGINVMDKFPTDVVLAESLSGGNVNILKSPAFMPEEKVDYRELFESPKKKGKKNEKQGNVGRPRLVDKAATSSPKTSSAMAKANNIIQIKQRITHRRFVNDSDHEVRIRQQPATHNEGEVIQHAYRCQECEFGTNRQNLFILHCKSHREQPGTSASTKASKTSATPKVRKSASSKATSSTPKSATPKVASVTKSVKKTEKIQKSPSKEQAEMVRKIFSPPKKGKRGAPKKFPPKTEEELAKEREKRNKILADWDVDEEEEELEAKKLKLDTSAAESGGDEPSEMEQDGVEEDEEEEKEGEEVAAEKVKEVPEPEQKQKEEKSKEDKSKDASSIYDIIEEPEAIAPPPVREIREETKSKEEIAKEKEKLDKEVEDLLNETAMPSLPELPSLPNIPLKKSENEQKEDLETEESSPAATQVTASPAEAKPAEAAKTNGEATGTTEEAATVTSSEEAVDANTETATYVLVTVDEGGFHQLSGLEGMGTTLYIDPSQLTGSGASLDNLYLAIDEGSMAQLDQQQVALQVGGDMAKTTQQDILAAALANTQVLHTTTALDAPTTQEAVVKVTNTTQAPVMTPRVAESISNVVVQSNGAADADKPAS